jgi:hypothetical protein
MEIVMNNNAEITSLSALFGRVFWMMIGPLALVLLAFTIVQIGSGWLTWADVGYLTVLGGMLWARWQEFRRGNAKTTDGQPATPTHWHRYVQTTLPLGLGVWVIANVVGNHLLDR